MSRIGKLPIQIPAGVTITVDDENVNVTGSKGTLTQFMMPGISIKIEDSILTVERATESKIHKSKHGLMRSLVNNMIVGVSQGFEKKLELNGVGYRVASEGKRVKLNIGFSHDVYYNVPDDIQISVEQNLISVTGINKQRVGQVAAEIRALKKPEPYKGKGIKYVDERIVRKAGKSGKDAK